ncbi:MAG: hypothetical protein PHF20_09430 [Halothiobacillaceae bacterium]|nr:hypothetical protein [Halothiobacillaceae bacterium]
MISHVIGGLILFCGSAAWAEGSASQVANIKDDETQLAQWFAVREAAELPYEYSLGAGRRSDSLKWSVANSGVNIASELEWARVSIAQIRLAGRADIGAGWFLRGAYETGAVKSGENRDSDYAGNDRTQEYARSYSKTRGAVQDVTLGLGRLIRFTPQSANYGFVVAPILGVSAHQQNLTMYDGQQILPYATLLTGLDNSYDTQWKSVFGGVDAHAEFGDSFIVNASLAIHRMDYLADANWNLRSDLAHPVSFRHTATGKGRSMSLGMGYRFGRHLMLHAGYERQYWKTGTGSDQTYFSYGGSTVYTLNAVEWGSESIFAGLAYRF